MAGVPECAWEEGGPLAGAWLMEDSPTRLDKISSD